ncbi:replication initiation factor domain-containing protein [[Ruminococcus] torques]|uniref:replication initiation factor domain-containing protein n=1 Tax=[Ruminococcus] torques TaxID=33039 RepID=UPI001EE04971|nr:replication initiation factor domain-containing protein [[Ruminococcus] torques]MCG4501576.1 replication initiation factor domain-containing protein [[Ruminococcus] torques]
MEERSKSVLSEPSYTNRRVTRQKNNLTALIDWCQITVKDVDLFTVITDILKIPLSLMELQNKGKGIAGHELVAGFDNIKILKPTGKIQYNGFQILMSGSGCRNYENFLVINKETWFDFFTRVCQYHVNFPRIDLAIDDHKPYLNIPELIRLTKQGLISSQLRNYSENASGELSESIPVHKGNTLYLGSSNSDFRIVFYEKGYEQVEKFGKELDRNWNRYELRFRQERANKVAQELIARRDVAEIAMSVLNGKIRFLEQPENKSTSRKRLYPTYPPWKLFMQDIEKIKLTIQPQKKTLDSIWNWLESSVAPSLKLFSKIGELDNYDYIQALIEQAKMNDTQIKIFEDYKKSSKLPITERSYSDNE